MGYMSNVNYKELHERYECCGVYTNHLIFLKFGCSHKNNLYKINTIK